MTALTDVDVLSPAGSLLDLPRGRGGILDCGSDGFDDSGMLLWGMPVRLARGEIDADGLIRQCSRDVSRGRAVRVRPGVYAALPEWNEARPRQRFLTTVAAMAISRPGTPVFCRQAALVLHDLPMVNVPQAIDTRTIHPGSARRRRPVLGGRSDFSAFAECCHLWPSAWREVRETGDPVIESLLPNGSLFTAEALVCAVADTVPLLPLGDAVSVLDALMSGRRDRSGSGRAEEPWSMEDLVDAASWCTSAGARQRYLACLALASERSESVAESWSKVRFHELGFEAPVQQEVLQDAQGEEIARGDFWWEGGRILGECDGLKKYSGPDSYSGESTMDVLRKEREREDRIRAEGIITVRWDWSDLRHPRRLAWKLDRAGVPRRG
ncbi:hypothetical protein AB0333_07360 [Citricoccus sp. NPDC079358]|uniref:hypothetical protein n=1 Tax=Citricoccus sp. NPDC079358 TaxID=3154653 RepID=UPI00344C977E